jgi:hypothetical protein
MIDSAAAVAAGSWIVDGGRRTQEGDGARRQGPFRQVAAGAARRGQAVTGVVESVI